jgi:hypothetical protein
MLLLRNSDYTTASNTNVTLASGAAEGDIVEIVSVTNLNSINTATTTTNTFTGAQTINDTLAINTTIQGSSRLQVNYNTTAGGYPWDNSAMVIRDSRAMTSGVGGGIIFEGNYLTAGGMSAYGGIRGRKSTSTNGDAGGYLDIWSRASGIRFFKVEQLVGSEGTPDMIIDSSGNTLIGTVSGPGKLRVNQSGQSTTAHFDNTNASWASDVVTSYSPGGVETSVLGISARSDGSSWLTSSYGALVLRTGASNSPSERVRIDSSGNVGIGGPSSGAMLYVLQPSTGSSPALFARQTFGSFAGIIQQNIADRANTSAYSFIYNYSSGGGDVEQYMRGDGQSYADGSWNGGGADYAEYFEWQDGNPNNEDRRGYSVSLINEKIKIAEEGDSVIGIVSGNPSVVGDDAPMKWTGKYLKDDFNSYVRDEDGYRILNPDYDADAEYISREDRQEWSTIGLMGKIRLRKGQVVGAGWIKMRDISETIEEWLVK